MLRSCEPGARRGRTPGRGLIMGQRHQRGRPRGAPVTTRGGGFDVAAAYSNALGSLKILGGSSSPSASSFASNACQQQQPQATATEGGGGLPEQVRAQLSLYVRGRRHADAAAAPSPSATSSPDSCRRISADVADAYCRAMASASPSQGYQGEAAAPGGGGDRARQLVAAEVGAEIIARLGPAQRQPGAAGVGMACALSHLLASWKPHLFFPDRPTAAAPGANCGPGYGSVGEEGPFYGGGGGGKAAVEEFLARQWDPSPGGMGTPAECNGSGGEWWCGGEFPPRELVLLNPGMWRIDARGLLGCVDCLQLSHHLVLCLNAIPSKDMVQIVSELIAAAPPPDILFDLFAAFFAPRFGPRIAEQFCNVMCTGKIKSDIAELVLRQYLSDLGSCHSFECVNQHCNGECLSESERKSMLNSASSIASSLTIGLEAQQSDTTKVLLGSSYVLQERNPAKESSISVALLNMHHTCDINVVYEAFLQATSLTDTPMPPFLTPSQCLGALLRHIPRNGGTSWCEVVNVLLDLIQAQSNTTNHASPLDSSLMDLLFEDLLVLHTTTTCLPTLQILLKCLSWSQTLSQSNFSSLLQRIWQRTHNDPRGYLFAALSSSNNSIQDISQFNSQAQMISVLNHLVSTSVTDGTIISQLRTSTLCTPIIVVGMIVKHACLNPGHISLLLDLIDCVGLQCIQDDSGFVLINNILSILGSFTVHTPLSHMSSYVDLCIKAAEKFGPTLARQLVSGLLKFQIKPRVTCASHTTALRIIEALLLQGNEVQAIKCEWLKDDIETLTALLLYLLKIDTETHSIIFPLWNTPRSQANRLLWSLVGHFQTCIPSVIDEVSNTVQTRIGWRSYLRINLAQGTPPDEIVLGPSSPLLTTALCSSDNRDFACSSANGAVAHFIQLLDSCSLSSDFSTFLARRLSARCVTHKVKEPTPSSKQSTFKFFERMQEPSHLTQALTLSLGSVIPLLTESEFTSVVLFLEEIVKKGLIVGDQFPWLQQEFIHPQQACTGILHSCTFSFIAHCTALLCEQPLARMLAGLRSTTVQEPREGGNIFDMSALATNLVLLGRDTIAIATSTGGNNKTTPESAAVSAPQPCSRFSLATMLDSLSTLLETLMQSKVPAAICSDLVVLFVDLCNSLHQTTIDSDPKPAAITPTTQQSSPVASPLPIPLPATTLNPIDVDSTTAGTIAADSAPLLRQHADCCSRDSAQKFEKECLENVGDFVDNLVQIVEEASLDKRQALRECCDAVQCAFQQLNH
ncbi:hypothetical protein Pelo_11035 [Pelomyxa schiedti]|nr:hypothetical protein Pelo_11035 [Pelomyxa schiedti]